MSEQSKLAAVILPMLPGMTGIRTHDAQHYRWASDIASAIVDSGQWVPRSVGECRACGESVARCSFCGTPIGTLGADQ